MIRRISVAVCAFSVAVLTGNLTAAPLNLVNEWPDIEASFITVSYTAGGTGDNFTATGFAMTIDFGGLGQPDYNIGGSQVYELKAHITTAGVAQGGTLTIYGTVNEADPQTANDPLSTSLTDPLLVGTLVAIGYPEGSSGELEFLFDITGGSAASYYGPQVGVKLNENGYVGSWASSFSNNDAGVADNFSVPEPATCAMLLLGLPMLLRRRRK